MQKNTRTRFLFQLDGKLPPILGRLPYYFAFYCLKFLFKMRLPHTEIWYRNSLKRKQIVFGLSDLDLTIFTEQRTDQAKVSAILSLGKKVFPFLGEDNRYKNDELDFVQEFINSYELQRDPKLAEKIKTVSHDISVEKAVFLLRMLLADKALLRGETMYRQKKWQDHFKMLGLEFQEKIINSESVAIQISSLFPNKREILDTIMCWLSREPWRKDLYHEDFGDKWSILYPELHLWFENGEEKKLQLNSVELRLLKRQIDWEIWGLYTQASYLDKAGLKKHIDRLEKALSLYQLPREGVEKFKKLLGFK